MDLAHAERDQLSLGANFFWSAKFGKENCIPLIP